MFLARDLGVPLSTPCPPPLQVLAARRCSHTETARRSQKPLVKGTARQHTGRLPSRGGDGQDMSGVVVSSSSSTHQTERSSADETNVRIEVQPFRFYTSGPQRPWLVSSRDDHRGLSTPRDRLRWQREEKRASMRRTESLHGRHWHNIANQLFFNFFN